MTRTEVPAGTVEAPVDWVPVEHRLLGMDRRSLVPAFVVAAFAAIAFWGVPALNTATALEDPVRAGDVIQLGQAATFDPAAGWNVETGIRQGGAGPGGNPGTAQVSHNGVAFTVITDSFQGTPAALLAQIKRTNDKLDQAGAISVDTEPETFTTTSGQRGVIAKFSSGPGIGLIAAFVFNGTGIQVTAYGPSTIDSQTEDDIITMLESVRPLDASTDRAGQ